MSVLYVYKAGVFAVILIIVPEIQVIDISRAVTDILICLYNITTII